MPGVLLVHAHKHVAPQEVGLNPDQEATLEINPALEVEHTPKAVMVRNQTTCKSTIFTTFLKQFQLVPG